MLRYLVMAFRTPEFQTSVVDDHYAFLDRLKQEGKLELAGPFTDKSGGAYLIKAANMEEAESIAFSDPVHTTQSSVVTVYEWNAK
ncbi:YciI family protein [Marinomonas transparens]|uniref:YCII-related domain-containing protein n=1 Tax=Marinomonas transparens TaxID=2795388 RepID=A0A934MVV2_9GAMM|nr:YciI family protein [Marinomonas transparens]MBJ7537459.1 hypothetical protein [Marinomonas transparens]